MRIKSKLDNNINIDRFKNLYREEVGKPKVDVNELNARLNLTKKENIFKRVKDISPYFQEKLHSLKDLECVESIRGYGLLGGIDIKMNDKPGKAGFQIYKACYENGVNFKATADALVLAPPFISEKKHIDEIFEKMRKGIVQYMNQ